MQEQVKLNLIGRHLFHSVPKQSVSEPRKISVNEKRKWLSFTGYNNKLFCKVCSCMFICTIFNDDKSALRSGTTQSNVLKKDYTTKLSSWTRPR